jgi:hypothetical protein
MIWFVALKGDDSDLEDLSKVLTLPELTICKEDDTGFVLKSTDFEKLEKADEVYKRASEIVELINGESKIALGSNKVLTTGLIFNIDDYGKKQPYNLGRLNATLPMPRLDMTFKMPDGRLIEINQAAPMREWYEIAKKDMIAEKVLRQLAKGDLDWNKLNIILEDVQGDVGSDIYQWADEKEVERFTQTVQDKRHGGSGLNNWQPHKNPISFEESKSLIMHIVENWLNEKVKKMVQLLKIRLLILRDFLIINIETKENMKVIKIFKLNEDDNKNNARFVISWPGVQLPPPAPNLFKIYYLHFDGRKTTYCHTSTAPVGKNLHKTKP